MSNNKLIFFLVFLIFADVLIFIVYHYICVRTLCYHGFMFGWGFNYTQRKLDQNFTLPVNLFLNSSLLNNSSLFVNSSAVAETKTEKFKSFNETLCLGGLPYGRFGNNVISILNARITAKKMAARLAIISTGDYVVRLQEAFLGEMTDVVWVSSAYSIEQQSIVCTSQETWESSFFRLYDYRSHVLDEYDPPRLTEIVRSVAINALLNYRPGFTVHGRSFEGACFFAQKYEHTSTGCPNFHHDLCTDYSYQTLVRLFDVQGHPVLLSDMQSIENVDSYRKVNASIDSNELPVQLWMMVVSHVHVGNPGSSLDFLVWLWKKKYNPLSIMHPSSCYPL